MSIKISWPKFGLECSMEPLTKNRILYDWFVAGLPYESVQGHAVVSGDLLYTKNITVPKIEYEYDKLATNLLTVAPVGTVFINVSRGRVGTIMIKYSTAITEDMSYPVIGQIAAADLETLRAVGDQVWHGYYDSKRYVLCQFRNGAL